MFRRLFTLEETQQKIREYFALKPLGVEVVPLLESHYRVLAEDLVATISIPPFDRSTVDGYAVRAEDTFGAEEGRPGKLQVCGKIDVGKPPRVKVAPKTAAEIVTGAQIPKGADAAIMVEHTTRKDNEVYIYDAVAKGVNVMMAGSDIQKGETILKKGDTLDSRRVGILAALGLSKVKVHTVPRVAILSTGAEVVTPGKKLPNGKIYDINAYSLSSAVLESGGQPFLVGICPDNTDDLLKELKKALKTGNMVVTSGGVSVGPKDIMPHTLNSLGSPGVIVNGVAIKPGKPLTIAFIGKKPVFSLPGHPTSALFIFHLVIRPIIQIMAGRKAEKTGKINAFTSRRIFAARGRQTFVMVKLKRDCLNNMIAEPVLEGLSGAITTLAKADGFVEIPKNQQFLEAGESVVAHLFHNREQHQD